MPSVRKSEGLKVRNRRGYRYSCREYVSLCGQDQSSLVCLDHYRSSGFGNGLFL